MIELFTDDTKIFTRITQLDDCKKCTERCACAVTAGIYNSPLTGGSRGWANPAMAPIQADSLAINFEFDIRPREVRLPSSCFLYLH